MGGKVGTTNNEMVLVNDLNDNTYTEKQHIQKFDRKFFHHTILCIIALCQEIFSAIVEILRLSTLKQTVIIDQMMCNKTGFKNRTVSFKKELLKHDQSIRVSMACIV